MKLRIVSQVWRLKNFGTFNKRKRYRNKIEKYTRNKCVRDKILKKITQFLKEKYTINDWKNVQYFLFCIKNKSKVFSIFTFYLFFVLHKKISQKYSLFFRLLIGILDHPDGPFTACSLAQVRQGGHFDRILFSKFFFWGV